ncbi:MAG: apolipoprotein N-acyltransferase, partial [Actinomycetota bacterium]
AWAWAGTAGALLVAPLLLPPAAADGDPLRVSIVQGSIPRDTADLFERDIAILRSHLELTREAASARPDLVVWPESSVGLDVDRTRDAARALTLAARSARAPLVVGGNLDVDAGHYKVMAFAVSEKGGIVDRYQKTHLVPFGEYVPARDLLDWIPMLDQVPRDAIAGDEIDVFALAGGRVAPVISFEGDFGSLVRRRMDAGGRLLIVATNTSTWGNSWASAQHLAFSQVRAAENGVWVVHAALTGISAFVAPDGRVLGETGLYEESIVVRDVSFADDITFYARTGDWLPWLCVAGSAVGLLAALRRGRSNRLGGGGREG